MSEKEQDIPHKEEEAGENEHHLEADVRLFTC